MIENDPHTQTFLSDTVAHPPKICEQPRYELLKNPELFTRLPGVNRHDPPFQLKKRPKTPIPHFQPPSMLARDQDFYSMRNIQYRQLIQEKEEKERRELEEAA